MRKYAITISSKSEPVSIQIDPNETLKAIEEAVIEIVTMAMFYKPIEALKNRKCELRLDIREKCESLATWIEKGGSEPYWDKYEFGEKEYLRRNDESRRRHLRCLKGRCVV